jgi:nicotinate-nucleotide adenylyltransferase
MKIGILGATFDPVHKAHMQMAKYSLDYCEYVLLMPCTKPPHKDNKSISDDDVRYKMLCMAAHDQEKIVVSDMEYKRGVTTYTVDTLHQVKEEFSIFDEITYIIGADTLFQLETWKNYEEVFRLCTFLVFNRKGYTKEDIQSKINDFQIRYQAKMIYDKRSVMEYSSSEIRELVKEGKEEVRWMLDPKVYKYIKENGIYR